MIKYELPVTGNGVVTMLPVYFGKINNRTVIPFNRVVDIMLLPPLDKVRKHLDDIL